MTSPLESRLQLRLQESPSAEQRGICLAELACYYARVGEFDDAERMRKELRSEFSDARTPSVSISIMMLEALLLYFRELSPLARDRMLRANLLSKSFGEQRLFALTSAWLAHFDFNQGRFDSMVASIEAAFSRLEPDDGSARCRVSVVLGDAFAYCRKLSDSRHWYEQARQCAIQLGDQATIGALIYNRAALQVTNLRLSCVSGSISLDDVALARAEVKSAINYQHVARLKSLGHLLKSAAIGSALLDSRYADALGLLNDSFIESEVPSSSDECVLHRADLAMCLAEVGRVDEARLLAQQVRSMRLDDLAPDDEALVLSSLGHAFEALGDRAEASSLRGRSRASLLEHLALIGAIEGMISKYRHNVGPKS